MKKLGRNFMAFVLKIPTFIHLPSSLSAVILFLTNSKTLCLISKPTIFLSGKSSDNVTNKPPYPHPRSIKSTLFPSLDSKTLFQSKSSGFLGLIQKLNFNLIYTIQGDDPKKD